MQPHRVAHRRAVARAVPGGPHAERLGGHRGLAGGGQPAQVAEVHPQKVNQPPADQRQPLAGLGEQLAGGDGRGRRGAQPFVPADLLKRQRVLKKEEPETLNIFRKAQRLHRIQPLVHVMQQLDTVAKGLAHVFQSAQRRTGVGAGVEVRPAQRTFGRRRRCPHPAVGHATRFTAGPGLRCAAAQPHAHVADVLRQQAFDVSAQLGVVAPVGVLVHRSSLAHATAQKIYQRQAGDFRLDVPQRHVNAAHGVVEHRAAAPVAVKHHQSPELFDPRDVAADQQRLQIVFHRRLHRAEPLREGPTSQAVKPRFGSLYLHHQQVAPHRPGENDTDVSDGNHAGRSHGLCLSSAASQSGGAPQGVHRAPARRVAFSIPPGAPWR